MEIIPKDRTGAPTPIPSTIRASDTVSYGAGTVEDALDNHTSRLSTSESGIIGLDIRLDAAEVNVTSLDGRLDIAEADIDALQADKQDEAYTSGVAGFSPTTIIAAIDALAGTRAFPIVTNGNGSYVRFENGLQVCWFEYATPLTTTVAVGNVFYSAGGAFAYAAPFSEIPVVIPAARTSSGEGTTAFVRGTPSATSSNLGLVGPTSTTAGHIRYIAVGKWK